MARASGVRIEIEAALVPCADGCGWREAVSDGEDYELVFAFDEGAGGDLPGVIEVSGFSGSVERLALTRIGRAVAPSEGRAERGGDGIPETGCVLITPEGVWIDADDLGWEHR